MISPWKLTVMQTLVTHKGTELEAAFTEGNAMHQEEQKKLRKIVEAPGSNLNRKLANAADVAESHRRRYSVKLQGGVDELERRCRGEAHLNDIVDLRFRDELVTLK